MKGARTVAVAAGVKEGFDFGLYSSAWPVSLIVSVRVNVLDCFARNACQTRCHDGAMHGDVTDRAHVRNRLAGDDIASFVDSPRARAQSRVRRSSCSNRHHHRQPNATARRNQLHDHGAMRTRKRRVTETGPHRTAGSMDGHSFHPTVAVVDAVVAGATVDCHQFDVHRPIRVVSSERHTLGVAT